MLWVILGFIAVFSLYLCFRFILRPYYRIQQLKKIPGTYLLSFYPIYGFLTHSVKSFEKHGDSLRGAKNTMRRWPDAKIVVSNVMDKTLIILLDPLLLKEFYQKQDCYHKYILLAGNQRRNLGNGSAFAEMKEWSKKRKIMSSIFHFQFYEAFIPKMEKIIDQDIQAIKKKQIKCIEAKEFSTIISGEMVTQTFFGISFKEKVDGLPFAVWTLNLVERTFMQSLGFKTMFGIQILKYGLFEEDRKVNEKAKIYETIVKAAIEKKMCDESEERGIFLQELLKKGLYKTEEGFDLDELFAEFSSLYIAGDDASSHHMNMCFYYLSIYPEIQEKMRQQIIDSKVLQEKHIDLKIITGMKYLDYFTKEVFRHYDFMGAITPREVVVEHQLGDLTITKNDLVLIGLTEQAFNPVYFPDPDKFDPDRWGKLNEKELTYIFAPFSIGIRNCFGQNFAMLEVKMILCKMVATFKHTLDPKYQHLIAFDSLPGPINPMNIFLQEI